MSKLRVAATCILVKVALLAIQAGIYSTWHDHDESTILLFPEGKTPLLSLTARFDSHFFISIAQNGHLFEKNNAFFELYPQILDLGTRAIQSVCAHISYNYAILIFALLLNFLLNVLNSLMLYEITRIKFPQHSTSSTVSFPLVVATLYQFTPSSAFYTAIYSESLFSFFILFYIYIFTSRHEAIPESQRGVKLFETLSGYSFSLFASLILASSVFVRSNGMFWVSVIGFPIIEAFIMNIYNALFTRGARFSFAVFRNTIFWGLLNLVCVLIPFVLLLKKAEYVYCSPDNIHGPVARWCEGFLPSVYNYIQGRFWDVGFLTYYKVHRIFLIIWGVYTFILIASSLIKYIRSFIAGSSSKPTTATLSIFQYGNLHGHMIYTTFLFFISVFYAHTQSSTRFFSSDPAFYWFIADILYKPLLALNATPESAAKHQPSKSSTIPAGLVLFYMVHFLISGSFLFSNYILWT